MKIFLSSVISGFETFRATATAAISSLGHTIVRAEDFAASPNSPQRSCLDGVRQSDVVVLLLGGRYGFKQPSGLSATHEEFREANKSRPVFAFVQFGVQREAEQVIFLEEVQAWTSGIYTGEFSTAEQLRKRITLAIHNWEVAKASGSIDAQEMCERAVKILPIQDRRHVATSTILAVAMAGGPSQQIIRPSELEKPAFARDLIKFALFEEPALFSTAEKTSPSIQGHRLELTQESRSFAIDEQGSVRITTNLDRSGRFRLVVIEEGVQESLAQLLAFGVRLMDRIDPSEKLPHVVLAINILGSDLCTWQTISEQSANPNSIPISLTDRDFSPVRLSPPYLRRPALRLESGKIAEDLTVLLKRRFRKIEEKPTFNPKSETAGC
jgi:hypothetical protein